MANCRVFLCSPDAYPLIVGVLVELWHICIVSTCVLCGISIYKTCLPSQPITLHPKNLRPVHCPTSKSIIHWPNEHFISLLNVPFAKNCLLACLFVCLVCCVINWIDFDIQITDVWNFFLYAHCVPLWDIKQISGTPFFAPVWWRYVSGGLSMPCRVPAVSVHTFPRRPVARTVKFGRELWRNRSSKFTLSVFIVVCLKTSDTRQV